ncbi:MAG: type II toxin-antitoxin system PemK/MazF family toxin [Candidatus Paceibacterota bacterium]
MEKEKDFDVWNGKKKNIHKTPDALYFREREIWWVSIGVNVGFEEDGKNEYFTRPVLVLKKFSKNVFVGIPLSTTKKEGKYYFKFSFLDNESTALLSQIRLFDTRRLKDKMGKLKNEVFQQIRGEMKNIL